MSWPTDSLFAVGMLGLVIYTVAELLFVHFRRGALRLREARMEGLGLLSQGGAMAVVALLWGPLSVGVGALAGSRLSLLETGTTWPWWIYGLVVYEFCYWVQHWAAHKVRILWCIHSPHHAPRAVHILVGFNHSFLESGFYFPLVLGFFPALLGVNPILVVAINVLDAIYGNLLHISDEVVKRGRYGVLQRFLQTPSHHRVHHARNVRYMDTNYNSITLLWDWVMGTLQPLRDDEPVEYGITRQVDTGSFWDVHFGEFVLLWRDFRGASSWRDSLGFVFRAPGWAPSGESRTASALKARLALAESSGSSGMPSDLAG